MINESGVSFYPGGGHNHDGENSTLINTSVYSVYDFPVQIIGDPSRTADQIRNLDSFKQLIIDTVNQSIIAPAGLVFQQGVVNGSAHIISRSISTETIATDAITANEIAANTITANEIAVGTITANLFAANIVLVGQVIQSNNYVAGVSGWAIGGNGTAEFANTSIRGTITANAVSTPGVDILSNGTLVANNYILYGNGAIVTSGGNFSVDEDGYVYANGASLQGNIVAVDGQIGSWVITPTNIFNNTGLANTVLSANGFITAGTLKIGNNDIADAEDIVATNIIRGGRLEATTKAGVVYTGAQANSNSVGDFGFSFYYNGTNVYARLTDTSNGTHFDVCLTNCGAGTTSGTTSATTSATTSGTTSAPTTVSPTEAPGCGPSDQCGPSQSGAMGTRGCGPSGIPIYYTCCNSCGTECIDFLLFCI